MDLPQVKAAVKAWEKSFKAKNKREPTKDDIKRDQGGIAEQYALYRKLSKISSSSSQPSSASTSTSTWQSTGNSVTPRIVPTAEYPTTPTPPARRATYPSRPINAEAGPSQTHGSTQGNGNLKRTASIADLQPSSPTASTSTALNTFLTPRKPRPRSPPAYTGPIHDPNPHNPFLASPSKSRPTPFRPADHTTSSSQTKAASRTEYDAASPFIHASSPRKLKDVLEANSLRKVRARKLEDESPQKGKGITPRTRARKRLRGEVVEDTPGKPQVERRKRGHRDNTGGMGVMREMGDEEEEEEGDEVEEDEFGQTPMKPSNGVRSFTSLLDEAAASAASKSGIRSNMKSSTGARMTSTEKDRAANGAVGPGKITQSQMNSFFGRPTTTKPARQEDQRPLDVNQDAMYTAKTPTPPSVQLQPDRGSKDNDEGQISSSTIPIESYTSPPGYDSSDPVERLPTPPPDAEILLDASQTSAPRSATRRRVLRVLPSDEEEETAQTGRGGRELVIVPTRRIARARRRSNSFDLEDEPARSDGNEDEAEDNQSHQKEKEENVDHAIRETSDPAETTPTPPSSPSLPPHLISLLSLRSPTQPRTRTKRSDLVVRSLFDPEAARQLRAMQRGQDVHVGGEDRAVEEEEEGEEEVLERYKAKVGFGAASGGRVEDEGDTEEEGGGGGGERGYGDDDWEEEDEGWKRTGEDMDDW